MVSGDDPRGPSRAADQVGLARDWLRGHGIKAPSTEPVGPTSGRERAGCGDPAATTDAESASRAHRRRRQSQVEVEGLPESGTAAARETAAGTRPEVEGDEGEEAEGEGVGRSRRTRGGRGRERSRGRGPASGPGGGLDPDADPEEVARTIVLRKLSAQARTRAELARALETRDVPPDAAGAVLDRMSEVGLVDDATFARDWVASRQQRRHLSRTALRRELQTKGVERDLIDDALADVDSDDEHRAALDLARRRASSMGGLEREVAYRRLGGVLARRGFSSSVTVRVLAEVLDGAPED